MFPHRAHLRGYERSSGPRSVRPQIGGQGRPRGDGVFAEIDAFLEEHTDDKDLAPLGQALAGVKAQLQQATMWLIENGLANPDNAGAAATDYLQLFGLAGPAYIWALMAEAAMAKIAGGETDPFFANKLIVGRYFIERLLPDAGAGLAELQSGAATMMSFAAAAF